MQLVISAAEKAKIHRLPLVIQNVRHKNKELVAPFSIVVFAKCPIFKASKITWHIMPRHCRYKTILKKKREDHLSESNNAHEKHVQK